METPNTAAELFDLLDEFMETANQLERSRAWTVLTALRGPDSNNSRLKEFTAEIRTRAFPNAVRSAFTDDFVPGMAAGHGWWHGSQVMHPDSLPGDSFDRSEFGYSDNHAVSHIQSALWSLQNMGR